MLNVSRNRCEADLQQESNTMNCTSMLGKLFEDLIGGFLSFFELATFIVTEEVFE